jgi:PIN domain nuclease of toxin-antitoxin system
MRLLLDTHAFLWWLARNARLSKRARAAIGVEDNEVFVSAASAWEIATKFRLGKRMLVAQSHAEGLTLITNEKLFDAFAVKRLW